MPEINATSAGADWAQWDTGVAKSWGGSWVVAIPGVVVEAGPDEEAVRKRAAEKLHLAEAEIVACRVAPLESRVWFGW